VIDFAVQRAVSAQETAEPGAAAPIIEPSDRPVNMEELITRIRTEADRTRIGGMEKDSANKAVALAEDLQAAAVELVNRSDYMVMTDIDGNMTRCNKEFLLFLAEGIDFPDQVQLLFESLRVQGRMNSWESQLMDAPLGRSAITLSGETLILNRSIVKDEDSQKPVAYVNYMKREIPGLDAETLQKIDEIIADLAYYNSLYAYGSPDHELKNIEQVEELVRKLDTVLKSG
jgi:hypothetical protein